MCCVMLMVPTYSSSQTHDDEKDNTPQNISVQAPLQQTALASRPTVVHHSFGFMALIRQNKKATSEQNVILKKYICYKYVGYHSGGLEAPSVGNWVEKHRGLGSNPDKIWKVFW